MSKKLIPKLVVNVYISCKSLNVGPCFDVKSTTTTLNMFSKVSPKLLLSVASSTLSCLEKFECQSTLSVTRCTLFVLAPGLR